MGLLTSRYKAIATALFLLAAPAAQAQVPDLAPLNHKVRYDVYWNGLALGRIRIESSEDQFGYRMTVDTKTRGIASMVNAEKSVARVNGRISAEGEYIPQHYESRSTSDDGDGRQTTITYDSEGDIKTRDRQPSDDPSWRPIVPLQEANSATDPITAFFILRQRLHQNIARNVRDTSIRTYEGARLAGMNFKVVSRANIKVDNDYVSAINTVASRVLVNGYTPKEIKKHKAGDPTVHIYFSADERLIPLKVEIDLSFGTLSAVLTEQK